jgi:hypothetical protein
MQPKRRSRKAESRKRQKRKRPRQLAPADKRERLKPISLHGMDFDDVIKRLVGIRGKAN